MQDSSNRTVLNQLLYLVVLPCLFFVPLAVITPCPYADDGGYARILQHCMRTGTVDLMHWSMPNAVGLILPSAALMRILDFSFMPLDMIGILFTIGACVAIYQLLRAYQSTELSLVLTLSLFCFMESAMVAPTFMTDMPFLCYSAWWLVLTQKVLSNGPVKRQLYVHWCAILLMGLLTRSTIILCLPGILVAALICDSARHKLLLLSGLFLCCIGATSIVNNYLVVNPVGLFESTALQKIWFDHDWKLLDLRSAGIAAVYLFSASAPALLAMEKLTATTQKYGVVLATLGFGLATYFSVKGFIVLAPLMVLACTAAAYKLPALISKFGQTDKPLSIILVCAIICQLAVMPIMSHPLTRHALPIMSEIIILCGMAKIFRPNIFKIYYPMAAVLILSNIIFLQQERLKEFGIWTLGEKLVACGISPEKVDAGWTWFCYYGLKPGVSFPNSYRDRYRSWQKDAEFRIIDGVATSKGSDQTIAQIPMNYLGVYTHTIQLLKNVGDGSR